jgi:hypothetical protein
MKPIKLTDLPPHVVARIRETDRQALGIERKQANAGLSAGDTAKHPSSNVEPGKRRREPNKTEARYKAEVIDRDGRRLATYEALTFRLANGHRYTPDWVYADDAGRMVCVEVKGAYRFGSHQRARLAFDQARIEWPGICWVWAAWTGGAWKTEVQHDSK